MKLEGFKSAWMRHHEEDGPASPPVVEQALQALRGSTAVDWERSREWSRAVFSCLFGLMAALAPVVLLSPGSAKFVTWIFSAALLIDGIVAAVFLARSSRGRPECAVRDFLSRQHRLAATRARVESYAQGAMLLLAAAALLVGLFGPKPDEYPARAYDSAITWLILTVFGAFAWLRVRAVSRSRQTRQELAGWLKDLDE